MDSKNGVSRPDSEVLEESEIGHQPPLLQKAVGAGQKNAMFIPSPSAKKMSLSSHVLHRRKGITKANRDDRATMNDFELHLKLRIEAERPQKATEPESCWCVEGHSGVLSSEEHLLLKGHGTYHSLHIPGKTQVEGTALFRQKEKPNGESTLSKSVQVSLDGSSVFGDHDYMNQAVRSKEKGSASTSSGFVVGEATGKLHSPVTEYQDIETTEFRAQFDDCRSQGLYSELSMRAQNGELKKYCPRMCCKIMKYETTYGHDILDPSNVNALVIAHALEKHGAKRATKKRIKILWRRRKLNCKYKDEEIDILAKIDQGAYTSEYITEHKAKKKLLALKVYAGDNDKQELFREDVKLLKKLRGCHLITQIAGYCDYEESFRHKMCFMFLELFVGSTLNEFICKYLITFEVLVLIIWQIGLALKFMHSKKIIHGDLTPVCIRVNNTCRLKIVETGSQKCPKGDDRMECSRCLTYTAPENHLGRNTQLPDTYAKKSDFFSLGVIAYKIIYGITPLQYLSRKNTCPMNSTEKLKMAAHAIIKGRLEYPHYRVEKDLMDLVINLLQVDPKLRISGHKFVHHQLFKHGKKVLKRAMKNGITAVLKDF